MTELVTPCKSRAMKKVYKPFKNKEINFK